MRAEGHVLFIEQVRHGDGCLDELMTLTMRCHDFLLVKATLIVILAALGHLGSVESDFLQTDVFRIEGQ